MINLEKYNRLKKKADDAKREADRAEGTLKALKDELKEEFGCSTLKEAKALLAELETEQEKAETRFNKELDAFEKEYGDKLE